MLGTSSNAADHSARASPSIPTRPWPVPRRALGRSPPSRAWRCARSSRTPYGGSVASRAGRSPARSRPTAAGSSASPHRTRCDPSRHTCPGRTYMADGSGRGGTTSGSPLGRLTRGSDSARPSSIICRSSASGARLAMSASSAAGSATARPPMVSNVARTWRSSSGSSSTKVTGTVGSPRPSASSTRAWPSRIRPVCRLTIAPWTQPMSCRVARRARRWWAGMASPVLGMGQERVGRHLGVTDDAVAPGVSCWTARRGRAGEVCGSGHENRLQDVSYLARVSEASVHQP